MNHDDAVRGMVSEKYLLDELAPEARDEFEEHLFGCHECALDVRAGAALIDKATVALGEPQAIPAVITPAPIKPSWWSAWFRPAIAMPAMVALVAVAAFQTFFELPSLKRELARNNTPQLLASTSLINVNSRGAAKASVPVKRGEPFLLFLDIAAEARFSAYVAELHDASGTLRWTLPISAEAARDTLSLHIPSESLDAGPYTIVVRGIANRQQASEIGRYPFQLEPRPR
jgi:hypothetical protein